MTKRDRFAPLCALAKGFHRQMEPLSCAYLLPHFGKAMKLAGITSITPEELLDEDNT